MRAFFALLGLAFGLTLLVALLLTQCVASEREFQFTLTAPVAEILPHLEAWADEGRADPGGVWEGRRGGVSVLLLPRNERASTLLGRGDDPDEVARAKAELEQDLGDLVREWSARD